MTRPNYMTNFGNIEGMFGKLLQRNNELSSFNLKYSQTISSNAQSAREEELGGKGYGLCKMAQLGLSVPPGFILKTNAWKEYKTASETLSPAIINDVSIQLNRLEKKTSHRLGDSKRPLFISIRSGAPISMPGAMLTILNAGINNQTIKALEQEISQGSAWEAYFDLVSSFGSSVFGIDSFKFKRLLDKQLPVQKLVQEAKQVIIEENCAFPENIDEQLFMSIQAVFRSWDQPNAKNYRRLNGISTEIGTAVIVQKMVWGNSQKEGSGSGVMLTRNIQDFKAEPMIAFAEKAQGNVVVGEEHHEQRIINQLPLPPNIKKQLYTIAKQLEEHFQYPQDFEFTYDGKRLWALQTRNVPLQASALFRFLQDKQCHHIVTEHQAKRLISAAQLNSLLVPPLNAKIVEQKKNSGDLLSSGISISLGNAAGIVVNSFDKAVQLSQEEVILAMETISLPEIQELIDPTEYPNIIAVIAGNAGIGSHIARIATGVGERMPIIFGANLKKIHERNLITVDGTVGQVYRGIIPRDTDKSNGILSSRELSIARSWYKEREKNPWRFVTTEEGVMSKVKKGESAYMKAKREFRSAKAQTQAVINALIPSDIRVNYSIFKPDQTEQIKTLAERILREGKHVTIRSCYFPDQRFLPWVFITDPSQIDIFFSRPDYPSKYGGYPKWTQNEFLTEVLVGANPKDKMSEDKAIRFEHGSWTLTCSEQGQIILQIDPHTPHLRGHEEVKEDDLTTCFVRIDQYNPKNMSNIRVEMGKNLQSEPVSENLVEHTIDTVFNSWWAKYDIPKWMAAATEIFPYGSYATPVLEGQTRFPSKWCLFYGMKIDPVEKINNQLILQEK